MKAKNVLGLLVMLASQTGWSGTPDWRVTHESSFRVWAVHSNFAVVEHGTALLYVECGPEGAALKRARIGDGSVESLASVRSSIRSIATVPQHPNLVVLADEGRYTEPARAISVFDVESGRERLMPVGDRGGDGDVKVSPSGRYLLTGIDYFCHSGDRDCFAESRAIFDLSTGERVFDWLVPRLVLASEPGRVTPSTQSLRWEAGDVVTETSSTEKGTVVKEIERGEGGRWLASARTARPAVSATGSDAVTASVEGSSVVISAGAKGGRVDLRPVLGTAPGVSSVVVDSAGDVIVVKVRSQERNWDRVQVVKVSAGSR